MSVQAGPVFSSFLTLVSSDSFSECERDEENEFTALEWVEPLMNWLSDINISSTKHKVDVVLPILHG